MASHHFCVWALLLTCLVLVPSWYQNHEVTANVIDSSNIEKQLKGENPTTINDPEKHRETIKGKMKKKKGNSGKKSLHKKNKKTKQKKGKAKKKGQKKKKGGNKKPNNKVVQRSRDCILVYGPDPYSRYTWKHGKIPFYFNDVTLNDQKLVRRAMAQIQAKSSFRFQEYKGNPSGHHLEIKTGSKSCGGCSYCPTWSTNWLCRPKCSGPNFSAGVTASLGAVVLESVFQLADDNYCISQTEGGILHKLFHVVGAPCRLPNNLTISQTVSQASENDWKLINIIGSYVGLEAFDVSSKGEAANVQWSRMGHYKIQLGSIRNNFPVWKKDGAEQYLFVDDYGYWGFGNNWNSNRVGVSTWERRPTPHSPLLVSDWQYWNNGWKQDISISVNVLTLEFSSNGEALNAHRSLMGHYKLQDNYRNDFPVWKKEGNYHLGDEYLFVTEDGRWMIGDNQNVNSGRVLSKSQSPTPYSPLLVNGWEYYDGPNGWKADNTLSVNIAVGVCTPAPDKYTWCSKYPWACRSTYYSWFKEKCSTTCNYSYCGGKDCIPAPDKYTWCSMYVRYCSGSGVYPGTTHTVQWFKENCSATCNYCVKTRNRMKTDTNITRSMIEDLAEPKEDIDTDQGTAMGTNEDTKTRIQARILPPIDGTNKSKMN